MDASGIDGRTAVDDYRGLPHSKHPQAAGQPSEGEAFLCALCILSVLKRLGQRNLQGDANGALHRHWVFTVAVAVVVFLDEIRVVGPGLRKLRNY